MFGRQKIAALVAEFLGAGALTLLVLTVQRSSIGVPFFIAAAAGLTYALMSFVVGGFSGGHFNPALTLGLWTARKVETVTAVLYIALQLLGAWGAYYLYTYFVNNPQQAIHSHFTWRIFTAEAVGTGVFALGFAAALYQGLSRAATSAYAGLSYMLAILLASSASLALLNPALALGVRSWVWTTYVLAPVVGAIVGANLYTALFAGERLFGMGRMSRATAPAAATAAKPAAKRRTTRRRK